MTPAPEPHSTPCRCCWRADDCTYPPVGLRQTVRTGTETLHGCACMSSDLQLMEIIIKDNPLYYKPKIEYLNLDFVLGKNSVLACNCTTTAIENMFRTHHFTCHLAANKKLCFNIPEFVWRSCLPRCEQILRDNSWMMVPHFATEEAQILLIDYRLCLVLCLFLHHSCSRHSDPFTSIKLPSLCVRKFLGRRCQAATFMHSTNDTGTILNFFPLLVPFLDSGILVY